MSFLDDLLSGLKRVTIAGASVAITGPVSTINFVSGATAVYNSATQAYDVTITGGGGGSVTWAEDLAGSNSTNQWVASISGPGGIGGIVPVHATRLTFDLGGYIGVNSGAGGTTVVSSPGRVELLATTTIDSVIGGNIMFQVAGTPSSGYALTEGALLGFFYNVTNPQVGQGGQLLNTAAVPMLVYAQSANASSSSNTNGGALNLQGGGATLNHTTGLMGGVRIQLGSALNQTVIEAGEVALGRRFTALNQVGSGVTTTQLPTNTGDGITWIGNAQTIPTASPVGGAILYATAGALWIYQSNGANFQISAGGGGPVTWADDLTGSTSMDQWVAAISGHGGSTAQVPLRAGAYISATVNNPILSVSTNTLLSTDGTPYINLGGGTGGPFMGINVYGAGTTLLSLTAFSSDFIHFGATSATSGYVRTDQGSTAVSARDAADTGDLALLGTNGSNFIFIGGGGTNVAGVALNVGTHTPLSLSASNTDSIYFGGSSASGSGNIRTENGITIITARNGANSADIALLSTDSSNKVYVGDSTHASAVHVQANTDVEIAVGGSVIAQFSATQSVLNQALVASGQPTNTSSTAGAASALPALPLGYWQVVLNSTSIRIPYYGT